MRFVAAESCDFAVVLALRAAGHDVIAIAEIGSRAPDSQVFSLAIGQRRILVTEDKDFGQLFYNLSFENDELREPIGIILLRFPAEARSAISRKRQLARFVRTKRSLPAPLRSSNPVGSE